MIESFRLMAKSLFSQRRTVEDVQQIRWEYELELLGCDTAHHGFPCKPSNTNTDMSSHHKKASD